MIYSHEVEMMCPVAQGANHGPAPIPEEAKWVQAKEIKDISGLTHGVGWCAPQQGACKLTLNVKDGIIQEALVETIGCSGMTHSAAMASEILPGKTILEALNTDLVCDAINTAMRELFLQIVYGRTQSAFSEDGLPIGAGLEDLGKGLRSQVGTMYGTLAKGPRYLEMAEGYVTGIALDENNEIKLYDEQYLYEGLLGALTSVLLGVGEFRQNLRVQDFGTGVMESGNAQALIEHAQQMGDSSEAARLAREMQSGVMPTNAQSVGELAVAYANEGGDVSFMQPQPDPNAEARRAEVASTRSEAQCAATEHRASVSAGRCEDAGRPC